MTLTSDQVNIIVYRYLQESGFRHTSFAFQHESQVQNSAYRDTEIQAGALINIIHKGLQFMDIEAHMNEDGELMECNIPFSLLEPHHCDLTGKTLSDSHTSSSPTPGAKRQRKEKSQKEKEKRVRRDTSNDEISSAVAAAAASTTATSSAVPSSSSSSAPTNNNTADAAAPVNGYTIKEETETADVEMRDVQPATTTTTTTTEQVAKPQTMVDSKDVHVLTGHQSEVFSCSWNPVEPLLLASGSGDATARLWRIPEDSSKTAEPPIVLSHLPNLNENKDVTTLDWNPSGTLLATGSYDGQARIWTLKGELRFLMAQHRGPIFSLKWNGKGDLILSGSADNTTVVWDPETGEMKQQYELHSPILDVDWMDNTTFASCSSDKTIFVCRVGETEPLKKWAGHEDEVNAVRWDPTGQYLASCSDDMTTKIWSLSSDQPVQEIRGHSLQIYTLQWAPYSRSSTSATESSSSPRILATASFDATVRLWDALNGTCLHVLQNHSEAVYSISFSPDARLLATGSFDEQLNVWNAKDGTLQETFKANGGIFEVHFNKNGDKLAACTSNKQVVILDMKR